MATVPKAGALADCDPYLFWADATRYAAVLQPADGWLRVAFELGSERQRLAFPDKAEALGLRVSPHYAAALRQPGCRHLCADVPKDQVVKAARLARRIKVGFIGNAEQADLGAAAINAQDLNSPLAKPMAVRRLRAAIAAGGPGRVLGLSFLKAVRPTAMPEVVAPLATRGLSPIVAVIDFGCAFAHPSFQRPGGGTRVLRFWDQGRARDTGRQAENSAAWPWLDEPGFGYGRVASGAGLDRLMHTVRRAAKRAQPAATLPPARFEEACYVAAALPELLEPWTHGTAVLGVAGGWPHPWADPAQAPDVAGSSDLIFVQLPQAAIEDLSGGWVTTCLLDAVEYVLAEAGARPVVINISIGSHGGPHDGGSLIEVALDRAAKRPGVSIVLAAGNAADKLGHAVATIPAGGRAELRWVVPDHDPTQSFLEFWHAQVDGASTPRFSARHEDNPGAVLAGATALLRDAQQRPYAGFVQAPRSRGGRASGMALLALAPTRTTPAQAAAGMGDAPEGGWIVTVENPAQQPLEVHAWVERDEPGASTLTDRPDAVLFTPASSGFEVSAGATLTGQATGSATWVVGGYEVGNPAPLLSGRMAADSGRGPARAGARQDCDALAPADLWIDGLVRGLPVLSSRSPEVGQSLLDIDDFGSAGLRGTSLAAPWVARQLCNLVAASPGLTSKRKLQLRLRTTPPQVDPEIGWL